MDEPNLIEIESEAIDLYLTNIYAKKVPEPQKPTEAELSFWRIAGISTSLFVLAALGVVAFSSIRTGGLFYILEQTLLKKFGLGVYITNGFSLGSMISSLLAFEVTSLAVGYAKGEESKEIIRSKNALIASQFVIITAGIFTGLGIIPNIDTNLEIGFYIFTALATAIAGGVVSYYSGDNLGFGVKKVEDKRQALWDAHTARYQFWRESGVKSYATSHFAVGSDKAQKFSKKMEGYNSSSENEPENENVEQGSNQGSKAVQNEPTIEPKLSKSEIAERSIGAFIKSYQRLPTIEEVKTSAGVSQGTASSSINSFIIKYEEYLMKEKYVNEARVSMAKSAQNK